MMEIQNKFSIRCNRCSELYEVNSNDFEIFETPYERNMGVEIEYDFSTIIICDNCNERIDINIRGYEYPIGAYAFSDYEIEHAEFIEAPVVGIVYEFDYELDNAYYYEVRDEFIEAHDQIECLKQKIRGMTSREFEEEIAVMFKKLGYSVQLTKQTRDGGRDIIATKADPFPFTMIVECKHWNEKNKVDVSVVRSLYGVQTADQVNQSVVVTSSRFSPDARKFVEERKDLMHLIDIDDLVKLM